MRIALALVLVATCAVAQTRRPATPKPKAPAAKLAPRPSERITSIEVRGSTLYSSAEIAPLSGLRVGATFDRAALEVARIKLTDTGLFTNVSGEYKVRSQSGAATTSIDIIFEVSDFPQRYPIHFDRLNKSDAELQTLLREKVPLYRDPLPYAVTLLDQAKAALAPVTGLVEMRITGDTPTDQFLLIHPAGAPPVVAEVRFKGGEVISNDELVFAMRGTAVGIEYREALFRELLKLGAVPLYEARGRIRVKFTNIEVETAKDVPGFLVTTTIEEGPSYEISDVKVSGLPSDRLNRDVTRAANLKPGDLANFEEVKAAQARMLAIVKRNGYLDATSTIDRSIDDEKHSVLFTIQFEPNEPYTFGRLALKGLDIISEPAVKKMWAGDPGKPFNPEYPEAFLARIKEQRMFDNLKETKATSTPNKERHTVDVTLEFR
jgi:outer membrane protein insertion porin family